MARDRAGMVAIVTGGSAGIGMATARRLRAMGWTVYAAARRLEQMAALEQEGIHTAWVDLTDDASLVSLVDHVLTEAGRIDVLVNNAGYGAFGAVEDVPLAEARRQFEVNVFGLARLCQLVLPHMRRQGSGRIINISSIGGRIYLPLGGWYHATKFAVEGLSDALRLELRPHGIDVVVIQPGGVATEWHQVAGPALAAASGRGDYAGQAQLLTSMFQLDAGSIASPPSVVAAAVARAARARWPRTRYATGRGARTFLLARWLLPDRAFDRLVALTLRALFRMATWRARRVASDAAGAGREPD
jgi:NAD(P)-dependent dehydrogenase (short-subunit alcohol dehydrogenase family)